MPSSCFDLCCLFVCWLVCSFVRCFVWGLFVYLSLCFLHCLFLFIGKHIGFCIGQAIRPYGGLLPGSVQCHAAVLEHLPFPRSFDVFMTF